MSELSRRKCVPCEGGIGRLPLKDAKKLAAKLRGWKLIKGKALRRELVMKDFLAAIALIRRIARTAEREGHHPDLHLTDYRKLVVEISTHAIGGLSLNDFILAAKIDALAGPLRARHRRS